MGTIADFDREVKKILAATDRSNEDAIKNALRRIDELRRFTLRELSRDDLKNNLTLMRAIQSRVESEVKRLNDALVVILRDEVIASFARGVALVSDPVAMLRPDLVERKISEETMRVTLGFSADLIRHVTEEARAKINGVLRRLVLGGLDMRDAQKEIGRTLPNSSTFKSVAHRAEAIVRTESLRVASQATDEQMKSQAKTIERGGFKMKKMWLDSHDRRVRPTHRAAGVRYSKRKAIEMDEFFIVGGEAAQFPRDPALSAGEAINCRCAMVPVVSRSTGEAILPELEEALAEIPPEPKTKKTRGGGGRRKK